jgi:hypothetical protein
MSVHLAKIAMSTVLRMLLGALSLRKEGGRQSERRRLKGYETDERSLWVGAALEEYVRSVECECRSDRHARTRRRWQEEE